MTIHTCGRCGCLVEAKSRRCPQCGRLFPSLFGLRPVLNRMFDPDRPIAKPLVLFLVVIYLVTVLVAQRRGDAAGPGLGRFSPGGRTLILVGAYFRPLVESGQWWRLVTACFLHAGPLHILFNGWALYQLGTLVSTAYGNARFLVVFLLSGVTGYLASLPFVDLSVGASGAICGLLGAALTYGLRRGGSYGEYLKGAMIQWLVLILVYGLLVPGVNNYAHLGGAAGGFAVAWLFQTDHYAPRRESDGVRLLALFCGAVTLVCFVFAVRFALRAAIG